MRSIKLDPAKLLGFKIVGSDDQATLLTSGVLNSAKIGDKGWGIPSAAALPQTEQTDETTRA